MKYWILKLSSYLPERLRETSLVRIWSLFNVPLLYSVKPKVLTLSHEKVEVLIPLTRKTKNHLNSMYFGALSIGADFAGGIYAFKLIEEKNASISFVFKDFKAQFLKRPEGDVIFQCTDGDKISSLVDRANDSLERVGDTVNVQAFCHAYSS